MKALHAEEIGGVVHCFSYSKEMARQFLDMGFYIGIGGVVTFKNAKTLKEASDAAKDMLKKDPELKLENNVYLKQKVAEYAIKCLEKINL